MGNTKGENVMATVSKSRESLDTTRRSGVVLACMVALVYLFLLSGCRKSSLDDERIECHRRCAFLTSAKTLAVLDSLPSGSVEISPEQIYSHLEESDLPEILRCPSGDAYTLGPAGQPVICSLHPIAGVAPAHDVLGTVPSPHVEHVVFTSEGRNYTISREGLVTPYGKSPLREAPLRLAGINIRSGEPAPENLENIVRSARKLSGIRQVDQVEYLLPVRQDRHIARLTLAGGMTVLLRQGAVKQERWCDADIDRAVSSLARAIASELDRKVGPARRTFVIPVPPAAKLDERDRIY